ncbi:bifunctional epoxide hydrolase 2 isoform X1 [Poecilia formosa]|uniref:bifunctional epoxide hydrolase 2 isoform X1 n=1 Tax=Poecilia formosa TaxID=48698 RepID=UPI000443862E|nr:PREDICTED: bifunctional epoxide hydrolase 2 isoform X1 [Poecilia formosa]
MAGKKAVLFNFWGVVVPSRPTGVFHKLEELHSLPRGFLSNVASQNKGALIQAEKGKMTLNQMIPAFQAECAKQAEVRGLALPSDWCVSCLLEEVRKAMMDVQDIVLKTSASLRYHGVLTAVLANHWLDDSASGDDPARLLCLLGSNFNLVLQSCHSGHRVPEFAMFNSALDQLGIPSQQVGDIPLRETQQLIPDPGAEPIQPFQALWLDVDEESVKAAETAGMKAVLVDNLEAALHKLSDFTGVQAVGAESPPIACSPDQVSHGHVTIRPGVRTHYVEMGSGPPVLLCHGFPESWYSWRYQIPALAAAGFRVLALDMKGYGESTAPPDIEEYSQEKLCKDLISFMDKMSIPQVTLVGHDWGGALVWTMARYFPERIRAVASLNTPLFSPDPSKPPSEKLKALPAFDYQNYFQKPGVAEAELENDLERTFKIFFSSSREAAGRPALSTSGVCARGGLFVGLPQQIPRSSMLTEADLRYYVGQFRGSGFRGPLNWYRNNQANWKWMCSQPTGKIAMPALMVTAEKDPVLLPAMSHGMEDLVPNLSRGHIEDCGHWTQMDKPAETNNILISWLRETHGPAGGGPAGGELLAPKL